MAFLNSQLLEVFLILQLDFDDKHVTSSENVWGVLLMNSAKKEYKYLTKNNIKLLIIYF